ncbi:MAG TPA: hypothetical protein PLP58_06185 [Prosthecobacter sp.]|nr:hypothetical protein [Prosthecobacter sp.]
MDVIFLNAGFEGRANCGAAGGNQMVFIGFPGRHAAGISALFDDGSFDRSFNIGCFHNRSGFRSGLFGGSFFGGSLFGRFGGGSFGSGRLARQTRLGQGFFARQVEFATTLFDDFVKLLAHDGVCVF